MSVTTPCGPLDLIFLQDLSGSFADDLPILKAQIPNLIASIESNNPDADFGVASFIDKPTGGFGASTDYVYQTHLAVSADNAAVVSAMNALSNRSGLDEPEAQLEGLLQTALRAGELGFRAGAKKVVMLSTDSSYHVAGDFGSAVANNLDAILDGTPPGTGEDYPSIAELRDALTVANIFPVFSVTPAMRVLYEDLVAQLGFGAVVTLTSNSANFSDAVRTALAAACGIITHQGTDGNDSIDGSANDDGIFCGLGDDTANGGLGDDLLDGGYGDDDCNGDDGNDDLRGGSGFDNLDGGANDDVLSGGLDDDTLTGGTGADVFQVNAGDGHDTILDFEDGIDMIDLSSMDKTAAATAVLNAVGEATGTRITFADGGSLFLTGIAVADISLADVILDSTNAAPITVDDVAATQSTDPVIIDVLANDSDIEGDVLSVVSVSSPAHGSAVLNADGTITYTAIFGFVGTDSFSYVVSDGARTASATVSVAVAPDLTGTEAADNLVGTLAAELFEGFGGDDAILALGGNDTVHAGAGNDTADGGAGNDLMDGGTGDDVLTGGTGNDTVTGGAGLDALSGGDGVDSLDGGADADVIDGGAGSDVLLGGAGNDTITGGPAVVNELIGDLDTIDAGAGDDVVHGGAGDDSILGGTGNDSLMGDNGDDAIFGGAGDDTLDGGGLDDRLTGEGGNDLLIGGVGNDNLDGGAGDDTMVGGAGENQYKGGDGNDTYVVGGFIATDIIEEGTAPATSVDTIAFRAGITFADIALSRVIDTLIITYAGGTVQVADHYNEPKNAVEFLTFEDGSTYDLMADVLLPPSAADITGTAGNDTLTGTANGEVIDGLAGDDRVFAGAGDDTVLGGVGNDTLFGQEGADSYRFAGSFGADLVGDGLNSAADEIVLETLAASDIRLLGNAADQVVIHAGGGNSIAISEQLNGVTIETLRFADGSTMDLTGGLPMQGTASAEAAYGTAFNDTMTMFGGNDTVFGNLGSDSIKAGWGGDVVYGDTNLVGGPGGNDTIKAGGGADRVLGGGGKDKLFGQNGDDSLYGMDGKDTLVGGAGDDLLVGGASRDKLRGQAGSDTFVFEVGGARDVVLDFETGVDQMDISAFGLTEADLSLATYGATNQHLRIIGGDFSVDLLNTALDGVDTAADFIF